MNKERSVEIESTDSEDEYEKECLSLGEIEGLKEELRRIKV